METVTALEPSIQEIVTKLLKSEPLPFKSDQEFLSIVEAKLITEYTLLEAEGKLTTDYLQLRWQNLVWNGTDKKNLEGSLLSLRTLVVKITEKTKERLEITKTTKGAYVPRLVRLAERFNLNEKELTCLSFIVMHNCGINFPPPNKAYSKRGLLRNMALLADMTPKDVLDFLSPERPHMKDKIFTVEDDCLTYDFASQNFIMTKEVLTAIMGGKLSATQYLSLDKTALADILVEDGFKPVGQLDDDADSNYFPAPKADEDKETDCNVFDFILKETEGSVSREADIGEVAEDDVKCGDDIKRPTPSNKAEDELGPYIDDLDYLQDNFKLIAARIKLYDSNMADEDDFKYRYNKQDKGVTEREYFAKANSYCRKVKAREVATRQAGGFIPRVMVLKDMRNLDEFEKLIILTLVGGILSTDVIRANSTGRSANVGETFTVGRMLGIHCKGLKSQIMNRRYFYKNATLVKESIISVTESSRWMSTKGLITMTLSIDRRLVDYVCGLDLEFGALVEGSHLYTPTVTMDQVVLPKQIKERIIGAVQGIDRFAKAKSVFGLNELVSYGNGSVLLFHGVSGTGKTLTANALAHFLGKKVLLASMPSISNKQEDVVGLIFREAKIQNALVFFDECENLFESRDSSKGGILSIMLTSIEKYDGIVVLATNRPYDLDEAMHRRIHLAVEFPAPSWISREEIWRKQIPCNLPVAADVDFGVIAQEFELTGGFIHNAVLGAIKIGLKRVKEIGDLRLVADDLHQACKEQMLGQLQLSGFSRRVIPKKGIDKLIFDAKVMKKVKELVQMQKASKILTGKWGFEASMSLWLIQGPSGIGKRTLLSAIAFELGKPIKKMTCAEILSQRPSGKRGADDTRLSSNNTGAIIALENAEVLFARNVSYAQAGYILFQIRKSKSIVVLILNEVVDPSFLGKLSPLQKKLLDNIEHIITITLPTRQVREQMWRRLLPENLPREENINFSELATTFKSFRSCDVMMSIKRAAIRACIEGDPSRAVITTELLTRAAKEIRSQKEILTPPADGCYI